MTTRRIRYFGDPILNSAAAPVARFDASLEALVRDMFATMDSAGGVGLAANQIGVARRVFVFDCQGMRGALVNPVWRPLGHTTQTGAEGCLSIPGVRAPVTRHEQVIATGADRDGRAVTIRAGGLLARCIQHETDHLDGVLFLARMEPQDRQEAMAAIRAADWFQRL